jgi:REP element-mobilizing transposase RayT
MRKSRQILPGARYHIIARANRYEFIFQKREMKELFLSLLRRAKKRFRFAIETFCIMDSHIHLIIRPLKGESISKIMQWLLSVFAIRFNKHFGLVGHVWLDRFKSFILFTDAQRMKAHIYILFNPVAAGLVKQPTNYRYSAAHLILSGDFSFLEKPPPKILELYSDNRIDFLIHLL